MASLAPLLDLLPDERVRALLAARSVVSVPDAARPFLLASLVRHLDRPVLAVVARAEEAENLARDLHAFLGREGAEVFPGWEVLPGEPVSPSIETMGRRLHVLGRLAKGETLVVVATAQAMTQMVARPRSDASLLELQRGNEIDLGAITERLVEMGY